MLRPIQRRRWSKRSTAIKAKQSSGRELHSGASAARTSANAAPNGPSQARGALADSKSDAPRKALEKLVETGKTKGFLTYDEVNDALPADVAPDQLDDVVGALGDEDI